mmetsp:Transcript_19028/g.54950  ORF Transcript_19028/g.54950 Transcript_19028/m.54950 type:complete len:81 (-) Transcript_19028:261-503(-)
MRRPRTQPGCQIASGSAEHSSGTGSGLQRVSGAEVAPNALEGLHDCGVRRCDSLAVAAGAGSLSSSQRRLSRGNGRLPSP